MPTKHVVKTYSVPAYYHVYNRASGERRLFRDDDDRVHFLHLLQQHLAENADPATPNIRTYSTEVIAFCLMGTHFHLLLYQDDDIDAISGFMRSVGTAYSMYYNKKYKSKGHVFQSSFRASYISNESYLAHITRYIHLNPHNFATWKWSSYLDFIGDITHNWVHPEQVLEYNQLGEHYKKFVKDYAKTDLRKLHTELHEFLAN